MCGPHVVPVRLHSYQNFHMQAFCQQWSCSLHAVALQNIKGRNGVLVFRTVFKLGPNPFPLRHIYNYLCYFNLKREEIKSAG